MTDLVEVGRLIRPHGVRGEQVAEVPGPDADLLSVSETVYVGDPPVAHALAGVRWHRGRLLVRLAGCDDRESAEAYRGLTLRLVREAAPLPPGVYYQRDILGLTVSTEAGEALGTVTEILETGANDVYVVTGLEGELLVPAAPGVVVSVDLPGRRMVVNLPDGLR
jgi:16S rRNA processing protein RimM